MKKKVFEGWFEKTGKNPLFVNIFGDIRLGHIRTKRGFKKDWHEDSWPPQKIRITVEYL